MAAASVLTFHDSADLFMQLVAETLKVAKAKQNVYLMDHFSAIEAKLGNATSYSASIGRLNTARNAIKHGGIHPAHHEIEGFRASVTNLFEDYSLLVFGVQFGAMSMVSLVANARVRERLQKAEAAIATANYEDAAVDLSWSFEVLVKDYEAGRVDQWGRSLFERPRRFSRLDWKEFLELTEAIEGVQSQIRILALGVDLHMYMAFRRLVPSPWWAINSEEPSFYEGQMKERPSEAGCRFCLDFVVESALRLQGSPIAERQSPNPS